MATRERLSRSALLAEIATLQRQAADLEQQLAGFIAGVELLTSLQPSIQAAHRNIKASINHLGAARTLAEAQQGVGND
jgi:exonuclease VII small subunit